MKYYIASKDEVSLLERFEGIEARSLDEYMNCSKEGLVQLCVLKDKSNDMFVRRYEAAREVIDIIARQVGIDPNDSGFWLYAPDEGGTTPITDRIEGWLSRGGAKAELKRRVQELEQEVAILRSVLQK